MQRINTKRSACLLTAALVVSFGGTLALSPRLALAQGGQEALSTALGVVLPKGAERWKNADKQFGSLLAELAKQKGARRDVEGVVETFLWSGNSYREERVASTKAAVRRALTDAGYAVRTLDETNDIEHLSLFSHFPLEDENLPFRPALTKATTYFLADNPAKGQSLLGVWLESGDAIALSVAPLAFIARAVPKPLPAALTGALLVTDYNDTMKGLPPLPVPNFPPLTRKPKTVRGRVRDSGGRPIAGAEIAAYSSHGGGIRTTHKARSNAQGLYEILLPAGIAELADATASVAYNSVAYDLPPHPVGGEFKTFNAQDGHVQNFYLQTAGDGGGTIRIVQDKTSGVLEVTLTPIGRALDGSNRAFVYRIPVDKDIESYINGVPIGRYTLTARLLDEGEVIPLRAHRLGYPKDSAVPSLQVDFKPGHERMESNPGRSSPRLVPFQLGLTP